MNILQTFINLTAGISLLYLLFQLVPELLSSTNTAEVIGGAVIIVSVLSVVIPQIIIFINKLRGKN